MNLDTTDLLVIATIAGVAGFPYVKGVLLKARTLLNKREQLDNPDTVEQWRQRWTSSLITLGREIEAGNGQLANPEDAQEINRKLMWEILGGDPDACCGVPTSQKAKSK